MKKPNRKLNRDRYGIIRGSVLLCVLILLCMVMIFYMLRCQSISAEKKQASLAAQQAKSAFEMQMEEGKRLLSGTSAFLNENTEDSESILYSLSTESIFSGAELHKADSRIAPSDEVLIEQDANALRFSTYLDNGSLLCAWIENAAIVEILEAAIPADYGYLMYDTETGEFLINHSDLNAPGYYDALLNLNENGSMEELLASNDGEALVCRNRLKMDDGYYIAQQQSKIKPWSIALLIPEGELQIGVWSKTATFVGSIAVFALLALCFAGYTIFVLRRIHLTNRNTVRALLMGERLNHTIASDAQMTFFIYDPVHDSIMAWYDGSDLLKYRALPSDSGSISCLAELCNLVEGEIERVHDLFSDRCNEAGTDIKLRGFSESGDERIWKLSVHSAGEESESVMCCISDYTSNQLELDREKQEDKYRESVKKKASSIWTINVSRDCWCCVYSKHSRIPRMLGMRDNVWNAYSASLSAHLREYLHPADYDAYADTMGIAGMTEAFQSGRTEFVQDYRARSRSDKDFEWHRMRVHMRHDAHSHDLIAELYIFNVDAKKNAELERGERKKVLQQALTALSGIYQGLYYVDLENDLAYTARSVGGELSNQICMPYKTGFEEYILKNVHPDDHERIRQFSSAYRLRKEFGEGAHFQILKYRRRVNDDVFLEAEIIVQPARFDNGILKEAVLAIRYTE